MTSLPRSDSSLRLEVAVAAVHQAGREALPPQVPLRIGRPPAATEPARTQSEIAALIGAVFPGEPVVFDGQLPDSTCWLVNQNRDDAGAFPAFGPSVTFIDDAGPAVCAILVPTFEEALTAVRNAGARLNGREIRVSAASRLGGALVLTTAFETPIPGVGEVVSRLAGWRLPSPAASPLRLLCYLATGRIDGFLVRSDNGGEIAAGRLLVEEAGGGVSHFGGRLAAAATAELLDQIRHAAPRSI